MNASELYTHKYLCIVYTNQPKIVPQIYQVHATSFTRITFKSSCKICKVAHSSYRTPFNSTLNPI